MIPEIPGDRIHASEERELREHVSVLLERDRSYNKFPGAQPISFGASHLKELMVEDYHVSEKADGVRVLLLLTTREGKPVSYLIDRKNHYYKLEFGMPTERKKFHNDTLVDGELVYETRNDKVLLPHVSAFYSCSSLTHWSSVVNSFVQNHIQVD